MHICKLTVSPRLEYLSLTEGFDFLAAAKIKKKNVLNPLYLGSLIVSEPKESFVSL